MNFYDQGLSTEVYDAVFNAEFTRNLGDLEFYLKYTKNNQLVIELGAGTGRITFKLAKHCLRIIGIENSNAMLAFARAKKLDRVENPKFIQADMRNFNVTEQADLIIIPFRSFEMLLTQDDQKMCIENVHKHLKNQGKLIIHIMNPEFINTKDGLHEPDESWSNEVLHPQSGNLVKIIAEKIKNYSDKQICHEFWKFQEISEEGKVLHSEKREITWRWTYSEEMNELLNAYGFKIVETHSDFIQGSEESGIHQIIVAEKV